MVYIRSGEMNDAVGQPHDRYETVCLSDGHAEKSLVQAPRSDRLFGNRPEILNRIGDNIIVFDFIRKEIAAAISDQMVAATISDVATRGIRVELTDAARQQLRVLCLSDLSNGGRGIRNKVEAHLINPLARALFDRDAAAGQAFRLAKVEPGATTAVTLEAGSGE
jgi:ATP-dependent Clp protease ATP-binding subunit ClpA